MTSHGRRSTPTGEHLPVLLAEVLETLAPRPGEVVVDGTLGWGGHAAELLRRIGPEGLLLGFDLDADNLSHAEARLRVVGHAFRLHHGNFAGLPRVLAAEGVAGVDALLVDLGMSSMQVDDPERGFSYMRDGPLDMRMDRSRGRTAGQLLADIDPDELTSALLRYGDEPQAGLIVSAIVATRKEKPIRRTGELADIIRRATQARDWRLHPSPGKWNLHPAARTFQALRILVNRELGNLHELLRVLPDCLKPGGRAAVISFHSGEDRLVKAAFRDGVRTGRYVRAAAEPVRASEAEKTANPRSRSAKLRWAVRGDLGR
jgi:16S rRNA (cytosine1402-N4)-methyltransferase